MASVSIDVASPVANISVKAKGARADKAPGNDGFGALVDSNIADAAPADTPAPQDRPQQVVRSDDTTPAQSDRREPREAKQAATKPANDNPNATAADATQIETDVAAGTPDVKVSAGTETKVTTGVATTEVALAAEITADTANTDTPATTEEAAVPASLLTVIAQTGIVPAAISVAANTVVSDTPAVEADVTAITGVTAATATAAASADVTIAAPAATATAPATDGAEVTAEADATVAVQTAKTDAATAATGEPVSTDDALLAAAAQVATATKPAKTAATGETTVEVKPEVAAQVTAKAEATAATNIAQPARKADAEPVNAPKLDTATTDTGIKPAAQAQTGEATTSAKPTEEQRPNRAAARADIAADASVQSDAPQNNAPQVQTTLTSQLQLQTPGAANAAAPLNASVQLGNNIAVPLSGLAVNIALNAQAGQSRFEIRLDPAELGRIDVRLDVDKHGQVTSHLTVERPATLDLLRRDAPQLQRALEDAGLKTGDSGLQFSLRDQSQQQQRADEDAQRNSYRLVVDEIPAIPAETARTYARLAAARGGVDIRI